jgi:predicted nucleotidyltransferase
MDAIIACTSALKKWLKDNLVELWLFGSKARGDFGPDSDIDLLVIVKNLFPEAEWEIREIAADYSLEYDVIFNTHILDSADWEKRIRWRDTLWREVQRDGIALTTQTRLLQSR